MDGAKGEALEKFCSEENLPFIRYVIKLEKIHYPVAPTNETQRDWRLETQALYFFLESYFYNYAMIAQTIQIIQ